MGFIKQAKQNLVRTEAERAKAEGRRVFVPMLNTPMTHDQFSGSIPGWAEMIEAVEDCGWVLAEWAVGTDPKGRPQAYPLFRLAS